MTGLRRGLAMLTRSWCLGMIVTSAGVANAAEQHWIGASERLETDGKVVEFPLPIANSGPTTIALAPDGTLWFTESSGNRIGRMSPDGSGLVEHALPNPDSSPRIIALGSDGNMWFSEHT